MIIPKLLINQEITTPNRELLSIPLNNKLNFESHLAQTQEKYLVLLQK